ncbi:MAG: hypothetical protein IKS49_01005 [Actinomycetaceae bacterium]|nr:hypothetical protein [Actinomycetaceae bacterium]
MVEQSHFARELNESLRRTSMSPEDVVVELNRRSFPLPLHTFSYWLQGYFLPRSEAAFQLLDILEHILSISDNRLADALLEDLSTGASFVPGEFTEAEAVVASPPNMRFSNLIDEDTIDWEANLIQKVVRDEVHLSADLRYARISVTILARVPSVPNPSFFFQLLHEDGLETGREEYFYDISGMTLKEKDVFEEDGKTICSAQFVLPDDVIPGDLHKLSYSWDEKSRDPVTRAGVRFIPWILDFYSCKVTFEGGIPDGIRYTTLEQVGDQRVEVPNDIPLIRQRNSLSISAKNFGNRVGYFEIPVSSKSGE